MRKFEFTWFKNEKYHPTIERKNIIEVGKSYSNVGEAAKAATALFTRSFGNLKKNTIVSIQEIDEKGNPVGEVITPVDETSIVPVARQL